MAVLRTNYQDDILASTMDGKRQYQMIQNANGTVSFVDVTDYTQNGDVFSSGDINNTNGQINANSSDISNHATELDDHERRITQNTDNISTNSGNISANATNIELLQSYKLNDNISISGSGSARDVIKNSWLTDNGIKRNGMYLVSGSDQYQKVNCLVSIFTYNESGHRHIMGYVLLFGYGVVSGYSGTYGNRSNSTYLMWYNDGTWYEYIFNPSSL